MNHLIVYAHPSSDSFSNEIMNAAKELSTEKGYKTEIRDLYSIGFDPVLKVSDIKGLHKGQIPDDIKREQNYIEWANIITIIYPVWWTGMPAILKGYIDRVFSYSMAYKKGKKGKEELLKGKIVFIFSPMGTSNEAYGKVGMLDAMKQTCDEGIFKFCGMKVVKHVFFGEALNIGEEMKKEYLKAIPIVFSKGLPSNKGNEEGKKNKESQDSKEDENDKDNGSSSDSGRKRDSESSKDNEGKRVSGEESKNKNNKNSKSDNEEDSKNNTKDSYNDKSDEKENSNNMNEKDGGSKGSSSRKSSEKDNEKGNEKNNDEDE